MLARARRNLKQSFRTGLFYLVWFQENPGAYFVEGVYAFIFLLILFAIMPVKADLSQIVAFSVLTPVLLWGIGANLRLEADYIVFTLDRLRHDAGRFQQGRMGFPAGTLRLHMKAIRRYLDWKVGGHLDGFLKLVGSIPLVPTETLTFEQLTYALEIHLADQSSRSPNAKPAKPIRDYAEEFQNRLTHSPSPTQTLRTQLVDLQQNILTSAERALALEYKERRFAERAGAYEGPVRLLLAVLVVIVIIVGFVGWAFFHLPFPIPGIP